MKSEWTENNEGPGYPTWTRHSYQISQSSEKHFSAVKVNPKPPATTFGWFGSFEEAEARCESHYYEQRDAESRG